LLSHFELDFFHAAADLTIQEKRDVTDTSTIVDGQKETTFAPTYVRRLKTTWAKDQHVGWGFYFAVASLWVIWCSKIGSRRIGR
jgi:hypothetical protein